MTHGGQQIGITHSFFLQPWRLRVRQMVNRSKGIDAALGLLGSFSRQT